jgi:hypothetical protein
MDFRRLPFIAILSLLALWGCVTNGISPTPVPTPTQTAPPDAATLEAQAKDDVYSILTARNGSEQLAVDARDKFKDDAAKLSRVQFLYGEVAAAGNAWLKLYEANLAIASKNKDLSDALKKGAADINTKYKALQAAVYPDSAGGALLDVIGIIITAGTDIYKAVRDAQQADRDRIVKAVSSILDTENWRPWTTVIASQQPTTSGTKPSPLAQKPQAPH